MEGDEIGRFVVGVACSAVNAADPSGRHYGNAGAGGEGERGGDRRRPVHANPGKVLSREQLLDRVWGYDYFGDGRLVDVHIRRLRTKIEPDPANPRHILTVRGMGYKLAV